MGLPGHRRTSSDKRRRSAQFGLSASNVAHCPKCKKSVLPHHACAFCGTYKGRAVINVEGRARRKTKKASKKD